MKNGEIGKDITEAPDKECNGFLRKVANEFSIYDVVEAHIKSNIRMGKNGYYLNISEDSLIEFKKGINMKGKAFDDEILKILQSFSNNSGGCIVFGIDNDSKRIVGVKKRVSDIDLSYTNNKILDFMSAKIELKIKEVSIGDKFIILLCAEECKKKPIMYRKNTNKIRDGSIYYRYNAETRLIGSAEIEEIIEDRIKNFLEVVKRNIIKIEDIDIDNNNEDIEKVQAHLSKDGTGVRVSVSDDKALEMFPLKYEELVRMVKKKYKYAKLNHEFHEIMKKVKSDKSVSYKRKLNPKGGKTHTYFYSEGAIKYFDDFYGSKKS